MSFKPFVPFRILSAYTMLEGAIDPKAMAKLAKERGFPAVAIADRNGLYGAVMFANACKSEGIQPIIGTLLGVARPSRDEGAEGKQVDYLPLYAQDEAGYDNLCHLVSKAHLERPLEFEPHVRIGDLDVEVMFTPGHTMASIAYRIGDAAFIHDTLFMPDSGSARADFPGGSAHALWRSIQRIMALPDETRLFTGHDYRPGGREAAWESTVARQRAENPHLVEAPTEEAFVRMREARDRELPMPKLILHSLQVNIRGGRLPEPEANGKRYLKIPLDALDGAAWGE